MCNVYRSSGSCFNQSQVTLRWDTDNVCVWEENVLHDDVPKGILLKDNPALIQVKVHIKMNSFSRFKTLNGQTLTYIMDWLLDILAD